MSSEILAKLEEEIAKNFTEIREICELKEESYKEYAVREFEGLSQKKQLEKLQKLIILFKQLPSAVKSVADDIEENYADIRDLLGLQEKRFIDYLQKKLDKRFEDLKTRSDLEFLYGVQAEYAKKLEEQIKEHLDRNGLAYEEYLSKEFDELSLSDRIQKLLALRESFGEESKEKSPQEELEKLQKEIAKNFTEIQKICGLEEESYEEYAACKLQDLSPRKQLEQLQKLTSSYKQLSTRVKSVANDIEENYADIKALLGFDEKEFSGYLKKKLDKRFEDLKTHSDLEFLYNLQAEYAKKLEEQIRKDFVKIKELLDLDATDYDNYFKKEFEELTVSDRIKKLLDLRKKFRTKIQYEEYKKEFKEKFQEFKELLALEEDDFKAYEAKKLDPLPIEERVKKLSSLHSDYRLKKTEKEYSSKELNKLKREVEKEYFQIKNFLSLEEESFDGYYQKELKALSVKEQIAKLKNLKAAFKIQFIKANFSRIRISLGLSAENYEEYFANLDKTEYIKHIDALYSDFKIISELFTHDQEQLFGLTPLDNKYYQLFFRRYLFKTLDVNSLRLDSRDKCLSEDIELIELYSYLIYTNKGYNHLILQTKSFQDFFDFIRITNHSIIYMVKEQFAIDDDIAIEDINLLDYSLYDILHILIRIWYDSFIKYETYFDLYYNLKHMKSLVDSSVPRNKAQELYSPHIEVASIEKVFFKLENGSKVFKEDAVVYLDDRHFENYMYLFHNYVESNFLTEEIIIDLLVKVEKFQSKSTYKLFLRYIINYLQQQYVINLEKIINLLQGIRRNQEVQLLAMPLGCFYNHYIENEIERFHKVVNL